MTSALVFAMIRMHGTQRLLTGRNQVLVGTLPCKVGYA